MINLTEILYINSIQGFQNVFLLCSEHVAINGGFPYIN